MIEKWRVEYNTRRPHSALGWMPSISLKLLKTDEPIRVENQTVAGRELYFVRGRGRSKLGQATKDGVPRTKQAESTIRDAFAAFLGSSFHAY